MGALTKATHIQLIVHYLLNPALTTPIRSYKTTDRFPLFSITYRTCWVPQMNEISQSPDNFHSDSRNLICTSLQSYRRATRTECPTKETAAWNIRVYISTWRGRGPRKSLIWFPFQISRISRVFGLCWFLSRTLLEFERSQIYVFGCLCNAKGLLSYRGSIFRRDCKIQSVGKLCCEDFEIMD